jgi:hypothetical protein
MSFDGGSQWDGPLLTHLFDALTAACQPLVNDASEKMLEDLAGRIKAAHPGLDDGAARRLAARYAAERISPSTRVVIAPREPFARISYQQDGRWHLLHEVRGADVPPAVGSASAALIDRGVQQLSSQAQAHLAAALRAGGEILVAAEPGGATLWLNVPGRALIPLTLLATDEISVVLDTPGTMH